MEKDLVKRKWKRTDQPSPHSYRPEKTFDKLSTTDTSFTNLKIKKAKKLMIIGKLPP